MYGLDEIIAMNMNPEFIKEHTRPGASWPHPGGFRMSLKEGGFKRQLNPVCRIHEAPNKA